MVYALKYPFDRCKLIVKEILVIYHRLCGFLVIRVSFVRNKSGKPIAIINEYTFYRATQGLKNEVWRCTRWGRCFARVIFSRQGFIVALTKEHNHPPSKVFNWYQ